MLIDALIFLSISLVYQWYFFRLYIFISFFFLFFCQRVGSMFFFFLSTFVVFLHFWISDSYHIFRITFFFSCPLSLSFPSLFRVSLLISFIVWSFTSTFQWKKCVVMLYPIQRIQLLINILWCWTLYRNMHIEEEKKTIENKITVK